ncbi:MAG: hypothetical protein HQK76_09930 [Desulfobacterales bacterium]|nr:hypothetical protein [Desulfobacterales bacterium]
MTKKKIELQVKESSEQIDKIFTTKNKDELIIVIHQYPALFEWTSDNLLKIATSKIGIISSILLLLISFILYYPFEGGDYDIWFHLKYGEYFIKNMTWAINHSQFSWTPTISDWQYVTWIGSSILYLIYKLSSFYGLELLLWSILFLIFLLSLKYIKNIGDYVDINYIMGWTLVYTVLKLTHVYIKPEMFTTLFFLVTVYIYFSAKRSSQKNYFIFYPLIFFIWGNSHGGFIVGLVFISLALFGEILNFLFQKQSALDKKILKIFVVSVFFSYIATLINPHGINYILFILESTYSEKFAGNFGKIFAYYSMWNYLYFARDMFNFVNAAWCLVVMMIIFILTSYYAYNKNKFIDLSISILNIVLFFFAMDAARKTIFFPIIWIFSEIYILKKADIFEVKKKFAPFAFIIFLVVAVNNILVLKYCNEPKWLGIDAEKYLPVKSCEFIMKNNLQAPLFNDYLIGGYMLWKMYPQYKVFIDPRYAPYAGEVLTDWFNIQNYMNKPDGLEEFRKKYPFKVALLLMRENGIITWMFRSGWRVLFFDSVSIVLIHPSLIPELSKEALATDLSTTRFNMVKNPLVLNNLFTLYLNINAGFGREILSIYQQNVSRHYAFRDKDIKNMEDSIAAKNN